MITLSLPFPPSVNALYRNVPGRGRVKTERYKTWLRAAGNEVLATPLDRRVPIMGRFTLIVLAGRPDKRLRDLDNLLKATGDLLQAHGLIENDCLAESIYVAWSPTVEKRRIEVRVLPWFGARGQGEAA
jgi:Holliday junction resolvase RusA-like endonuclease